MRDYLAQILETGLEYEYVLIDGGEHCSPSTKHIYASTRSNGYIINISKNNTMVLSSNFIGIISIYDLRFKLWYGYEDDT